MLDALAVSVAAVALLATVLLSILAAVVSLKFSGVEAQSQQYRGATKERRI